MKRVALAVVAAASFAFAATAAAETWTEPSGMFSFDKPAGWEIDDLPSSNPANKAYVVGTADDECYIIGFPREQTKLIPPHKIVESWSVPFDAQKWKDMSASQKLLGGSVEVKVSLVDTKTGPFPIQTAMLQGAERVVTAAIHPRPGLEIFVFCGSYVGQDSNPLYDKVAMSIKTPGDEAWAATLAARAAEQAAKEKKKEE